MKKKIVKKKTKVSLKDVVVPTIKEELTELEKFFIKENNSKGVTLEEIKKTIKKDESLIVDFLNGLKRKGPSQFEQTVVRKTATGQDDKGITIANKASSEFGDDANKQIKILQKETPIRYSGNITTIKEK